ncbi:LOW QUALITY PROTEIN: hypothetical protein TorRG33x02_218470 [Trema orientale]|uniref:Uncharacterized protein n=1 Tax=Trema orientale TaxID=63057 RepID=A0A2P5E9W5_TREOI|nr:LOW QUALITY PROTEIN: hypothetical protein TorRG33x02_218470 [Trema orientale]
MGSLSDPTVVRSPSSFSRYYNNNPEPFLGFILKIGKQNLGLICFLISKKGF